MANKQKLSDKYINALKLLFADYTNREVAEMLSVRINEDNACQAYLIREAISNGTIIPTKNTLKELNRLDKHVSVSERTIQNYASSMGLRKSEKFKHQYRNHSYRKKNMIRMFKNAVRYSGSPAKEIKMFNGYEDRVIRFESDKAIDSLLSAINRHNKEEKSRSGKLISVGTFRDMMLVVMMEKPPSTYSYRNQLSPEEFLSSPP